MGELSNAEVVRLAEAARQTFRQIAMAWSLTDQEQSALLGSRLRSPLLSHIQAHPMLPGQRRLSAWATWLAFTLHCTTLFRSATRRWLDTSAEYRTSVQWCYRAGTDVQRPINRPCRGPWALETNGMGPPL